MPDALRRNTRSNVNEGPNPRKPMGLRAFLALGVVASLTQAASLGCGPRLAHHPKMLAARPQELCRPSLAKELVLEFEENYPDCRISEVYGVEKYQQFWKAISFLEDGIAETRKNQGQRLQAYLALSLTDEFNQVVEFCRLGSLTRDELQKKQGQQKRELRRWQIATAVAVISLMATVVGMLKWSL